MKKFILQTGLFLILFFGGMELIARVFIDPFYFFKQNTYNEKQKPTLKNVYSRYLFGGTSHADFLFIGSSRVPATINPKIFKSLYPNKKVVIAGKGFMNAGIHYQALKNKLKKHPNYLENTLVLIEYPGCGLYPDHFLNPFLQDQLKVPENKKESKSHLILPHLSFFSLLKFFKKSHNSYAVKLETSFMYLSSFYRVTFFIKESLFKIRFPFFEKKQAHKNLTQEGGIRTDNIQFVARNALNHAQKTEEIIKKTNLSLTALEQSSLAFFYNLITQNGGKLLLYRMPLHSLLQEKHETEKAKKNQRVLEQWLKSKNIKIIDYDSFSFSDADFPDVYHLGKNRQEEFTLLLHDKLYP